jgi:hypothetical protein
MVVAFVLCFFVSSPAVAADGDFGLGGYLFRVLLAFSILGVAGWALVKFGPRRFNLLRPDPRARVLSLVPLGRSVLYVLRLGPQVVAVLIGKNGAQVLGRWSREEWTEDEHEIPYS